ncbi:MAG: hypothetical protein IJ273_01190 [Alphaproteobacteria bacterium]|nr:hypothetical protein [Alphaproteobacteria bacterium]MBQ8256176.1 hypothetical protein [Alphaproteobacteria bacterium]
MSNERENFNGSLKFVDYDISGNYLRAYYDADDKLVFVLDFAVSATKPNVLLVINPVGIRKWDDILTNDYGVDLEDVRPKKDNKYQKLDIEYSGLGVYDALIRAYVAGDGVDGATEKLQAFRNMASRNAAFERLGAADVMAKNARETIEKTKETIKELQERLKNLRTKLSAQRKDIGKEPTKQSASKILRTEAQIDAVNEKMARAKKRLASAQRRLIAAEDDADVARGILDALLGDADVNDDQVVALPAMPASTDVAVTEPAPVPMNVVPEFTDLTTETKAEDMADEEVKPLFDEDPEILDENIAFKPIDFNANKETQVAPVVAEEKTEMVQPLSFVPPVDVAKEEVPAPAPAAEPAPVLDSLTTVPAEQIDSELMATIDIPGFSDVPDVSSQSSYEVTEEKPVETEPVVPVAPVAEYAEPTVQEIVEESVPTPMPEIEEAPTAPETRPVSPITGATSPVTAVRRKPTMLYYILLIILIVLSVFTLWFYQKSAPDTAMPVLDVQVAVAEEKSEDVTADADKADEKEAEAVAEEKTDVPSPFIDLTVVDDDSTEKETEVQEAVAVEPVVEETEEVDVTPVVEELADVEINDIDIDAAVFPDIEPVAVQVAPEPEKDIEESVVAEEETATDSPFLSDEVVAPAETKSVADIIAVKPVYNVSQQEKMFVADEEYETDAEEVVEEEVDVDAPVVEYSEPAIVGAAEILEEEQQMCSDGNAPDMNGCCAGENFMDGLCCAESTGECFEPMK